MGNHIEYTESKKGGDSLKDSNLSALSVSLWDECKQTVGRDQQKTALADGILPELNFEARTGSPASKNELKDSGVKLSHNKDGGTTGEYPSGVRVDTTPGARDEKHHVTIGPGSMLQAEKPNHMTKDGEVVDPKGRVLAKMNDDGSVTVDSGKGFYTHYPDGEVRRESAIRSRDGKTFEVIDTNTPLGNLRPSDMTKHRK